MCYCFSPVKWFCIQPAVFMKRYHEPLDTGVQESDLDPRKPPKFPNKSGENNHLPPEKHAT